MRATHETRDQVGDTRSYANIASSDPAGVPFHLFFPTRIPSHLPFLLHAYFQVDAGRKGFAEDEERFFAEAMSPQDRKMRHFASANMSRGRDFQGKANKGR